MTQATMTRDTRSAPVAKNEAADREAIRGLMDSYVAYFLAGDGEKWAALFDEDALWMPPGEPTMGFEHFSHWAKTLRPGHADAFANDDVEIQIMGDWAFTTGTYTLDTPTKDGRQAHVGGKFLDILKRQADGSWKIYRTMFNLNTS